jgi:hypothetical protein
MIEMVVMKTDCVVSLSYPTAGTHTLPSPERG